MHFPENSEVISAFRFDGKKWAETGPVTASAGQYESPAASCAPGGKSVVAWAEIKGNDWDINVALNEGSSFTRPYTFPVKQGKVQ